MKQVADKNHAVLKGCFEAPLHTLGENETNCVTKIVFLTLWELGWNPISQIMLKFQIPKDKVDKPAQASNEADVVVVDSGKIFLVGEVKDWYESLGSKEITQTRIYQKALNAPSAFLTNGHKWLIFEQTNSSPLFSYEFDDAENMLLRLRDTLGQGKLTSNPLPYENALEKGLSIKSGIKNVHHQKKVQPSCNWKDYSNPAVKAMIKELCRLKNSRKGTIIHDFGESSLMLKDLRTEYTIIEYRPGPTIAQETEQKSFSGIDKILKRPAHYAAMKIPDDYVSEFADTVNKYNKRKVGQKAVVQVLERIIEWLQLGHKSNENTAQSVVIPPDRR